MKNLDIRKEAEQAGVKLWHIAEAIGINDSNFSRRLRKELPEEEKQKIRGIIADISADRSPDWQECGQNSI